MKKLIHLVRISMIFIVITGCECFLPGEEYARRFSGYKILRGQISNEMQFKELRQLRSSSKFDFWTEPVIKGNVDIMVSHDELGQLTSLFQKLHINHTVLIEDLSRLIRSERENRKASRTQSSAFGWKKYFSYDEITAWAKSLTLSCKNLVRSEIFGRSTESRPLILYKFSTGGENKPSILIDGGFHAREFISPAVVTYFMNDLCFNKTNEFLDNVDIYIAPLINPDGYEYARKVDRMWRKTRSNHNAAYGCRGVDPNRNFDFHFGGSGTSRDKCSEIYRGPHPFSEPETRALRDVLLRNATNWVAYITVHSYGQAILMPYSYSETAFPVDYQEMESLANISAQAISRVHGTSFDFGQSAQLFGTTAGCADDWAKAIANVTYAYTYELRDEGRYGFLLPQDLILPTAEESQEAFKTVARHVARMEASKMKRKMKI